MYADNVKIKPNEIIYMNLEMHFTLISLTRSILNNKNCRSKCKENWQTNEWDNEWKWYSHLSQLKMHLAHAITHIHRIASQNQSIAVWFCVLISFYLFVRMKKKKREEKTRQFVFTICIMYYHTVRQPEWMVNFVFRLQKCESGAWGITFIQRIYITLCEHNTYLINRIMKSRWARENREEKKRKPMERS